MIDDALAWSEVDSPLGNITLTASSAGLTALRFGGAAAATSSNEISRAHLRVATAQLREYFAGTRQHFDVPLAPRGTAFDHLVWDALREIPHGTTLSYGELARQLGRPGAARAVGHANGRNPLAIIVPCHRVIASDGSLGGYAGGLDFKHALLALETKACAVPTASSPSARR